MAEGHIPLGITPILRLMVAERADGLLHFQLGFGPCPVADLRQCAGRLSCVVLQMDHARMNSTARILGVYIEDVVTLPEGIHL